MALIYAIERFQEATARLGITPKIEWSEDLLSVSIDTASAEALASLDCTETVSAILARRVLNSGSVRIVTSEINLIANLRKALHDSSPAHLP